MSPETKAFIAEGLAWLQKFDDVAKIATNSELVKIASAAVPGIATVAADVRMVEGGIDLIEAIAPKAEAVAPLLISLAHSAGMTPEETAALRQSRIDEANKTG